MMRCPRCSEPIAPEDLYCENCGKTLREDPAFGEEFEEEFQFDEERLAKSDVPVSEEKETLRRIPFVTLLFAALLFACAVFLILYATGVLHFSREAHDLSRAAALESSIQKDDTLETQEPPEPTLENDRFPLEPSAEAALCAFHAQVRDCDLDTLLSLCLPRARAFFTQALCTQSGTFDLEEAKRALALEKSQQNADCSFTSAEASVSHPYNEEEKDAALRDAASRSPLSFYAPEEIKALCEVCISYEWNDYGTPVFDEAIYLVAETQEGWFVANLPQF